MVRFRKSMSLLFLLFFTGCASEGFIRSEYSIEVFEDLITSNSVLFDQKYKIDHEKGKLKFQFAFLAENHSKSKTYSLDLAHTTFTTNSSPQSVSCLAQSSNHANLAPGDRAKVECNIEVIANAANQLTQKDTLGVLKVPIQNSKSGAIQYSYKFRVEDFQ